MHSQIAINEGIGRAMDGGGQEKPSTASSHPHALHARRTRAALHRAMDDGQHWTHSIAAKDRCDHTLRARKEAAYDAFGPLRWRRNDHESGGSR